MPGPPQSLFAKFKASNSKGVGEPIKGLPFWGSLSRGWQTYTASIPPQRLGEYLGTAGDASELVE